MSAVSQPKRPMIVCYGDLVTDLVVAVERLPIEPERVQSIHAITIEPGGAGNFLITAARLGVHAVAFGAVGEDAYGQAVYEMLQAEGVDVSYAQRGTGSVNVLVMVIVDDAGRHVFLVRDGTGDPFVLDGRSVALIRSADLFFMPGYALHERRVAGSAVAATRVAAESGVPVMNDLGPIVSEASVRAAALEIVQLSEVSLLTADEALRFTSERSEADAAAWMLARGTRCVVIKRGEAGCAVYAGDGCYDVAGIPVPVRDTTAAGDAFAAGFAVSWLKHRDVRRAAEFANCVGAAKVQKLGSGRQCPTAAEIARVCGDAFTE
ncbi:MAG: carbohydrate kinase family protein [Thermoflexales bacterium]|nr:carbohydrate kinase family protein [Thermoflexales bacterium]MDW8350435.1 carbohydrate kinase family protein [Anaerolineae bacterium]